MVITGRNAENLAKVAAEIEKVGKRPLQIVGDLLDEATPVRLVSETIAAFGRLDILVNNAGGVTGDDKLASPNLMKSFDFTMKLNVRSVVQLTQLAAPHLEKVHSAYYTPIFSFLVNFFNIWYYNILNHNEKTKGNIVNISSIASKTPVR